MLVIPIGPVIAAIASWFQNLRSKPLRDSRIPDLKSPAPNFGFDKIARLPSPENEALDRAQEAIAEGDFERAKQILISAWLPLPEGSEFAYIRLKEGFVKVYEAKKEKSRAEAVAATPIILMDRDVRWLAEHPEQELGSVYSGSAEAQNNHDIGS